MEREILFRGKSTKTFEWVEGNYEEYVDEQSLIRTESGEIVSVFQESVGKYVGFRDKNGTKIFEGDIVYIISSRFSDYYGNYRTNEYTWFLVTFEKFDIQFRILKQIFDNTVLYCPGCNFEKFNKSSEVVGNCFDNEDFVDQCKSLSVKMGGHNE